MIDHRGTTGFIPSERVRLLELPERAGIAPPNVRQADIDILSHLPEPFLDTTHFDTEAFPPPDYAIELFSKAARDGALAYTGYRGHPDVLEVVAANVSAFMGLEIDPRRNVALLPGTQAGLFAALAARINRGDKVAVMDPDYLFTGRMLRFLEAEPVYIPLVLEAGAYTPDLEAMARVFRDGGVRHLVFSHPNNPTGAVYGPATIAAIAALSGRYGVGVVVDELYSRLVYGDTPFAHLAAEAGAFERTVTLLGPSKTESLTGYRVGVVVAPDAILGAIENVLSITSLRAPAYGQHVLGGWLGPDHEWIQHRLRAFAQLRQLTWDRLSQVPWMRIHPQAATAYFWADVRQLGLPDIEIGRRLARDAAMLVSMGYQFGPASHGHFRICYAREPDSWKKALDRMVAVLGAEA